MTSLCCSISSVGMRTKHVNSQRIEGLRLKFEEGIKNRWIYNWLGIIYVGQRRKLPRELPQAWLIRMPHDKYCVLVIVFLSTKFRKSGWQLRRNAIIIDDVASPKLTLGKGIQVKPSNDSEVVRASTESFQQIWMMFTVDIQDSAICQHDLVIQHVVANETLARWKKRYAA